MFVTTELNAIWLPAPDRSGSLTYGMQVQIESQSESTHMRSASRSRASPRNLTFINIYIIILKKSIVLAFMYSVNGRIGERRFAFECDTKSQVWGTAHPQFSSNLHNFTSIFFKSPSFYFNFASFFRNFLFSFLILKIYPTYNIFRTS